MQSARLGYDGTMDGARYTKKKRERERGRPTKDDVRVKWLRYRILAGAICATESVHVNKRRRMGSGILDTFRFSRDFR